MLRSPKISNYKNAGEQGKEARLTRILLDGRWKFRKLGDSEWLNATVPGINFTDLLQNGIIDHPFYRNNEYELQWIENEDWEYLRNFEIEEELLTDEVNLVFEGLDTFCEIYLNGEKILESDNMFIPYRIPCKGLLKSGKNEVHLIFRSPIKAVEGIQKKGGFRYPAENDKTVDKLSVFIRKAPYHFGWDWGPKFVTSGIWQSCYLEVHARTRIHDVAVKQQWVNEELVNAIFSVEVEGSYQGPLDVEIFCENHPELELIRETLQPQKSFKVAVKDPVKWWPFGLGESHLYQFKVRVCDGEEILNERSIKIGFRTIEVVNEPDEHGESFFFRVNGHPVFAKGANYIPSDSFLPETSDQKYRQLFEDTCNANMNMLRVWGGGIYEKDIFYELADEYGVLIWQDFMFSCTLYPANDEFLDNVRNESIHNIKRLRNHACLALWCGNNEVEMGIAFWGWKKSFNYPDKLWDQLQEDYKKLFKEFIPNLVREYDPDRFYFSSSPISFWENPDDDNKGDNHYWGVWHGEEDFEEFRNRVPRFMSEFGFQSFPLLQSVKKFTVEEDWDITSEVMTTHQKHPRGNGLIKKYMLKDFPEPNTFEQFLYQSQVLQADGMKVGLEAHRAAKPFCMGTLYWQINDCWPVASWSSIDYYGRWKALHYQAKRSFSRDLLVIAQDKDEVTIKAITDGLNNLKATLTIQVYNFSGENIIQSSKEIELVKNNSVEVFRVRESNLIRKHVPGAVYLLATLYGPGVETYETIYYFRKPNELSLTKPTINFQLKEVEDKLFVELQSDSLVKSLYVYSESLEGNFSDNFFDLLPNKKKIISIERPQKGTEYPEIKFLYINPTR